MTNNIEATNYGTIWDRLSKAGKRLVIALISEGDFPLDKQNLIRKSSVEGAEFNLAAALRELDQFGLLERMSYRGFQEEKLSRLPEPDEIHSLPFDQVPSERKAEWLAPLTAEELTYTRVSNEIEARYQNSKGKPDLSAKDERPRLRLDPGFANYISREILQLDDSSFSF